MSVTQEIAKKKSPSPVSQKTINNALKARLDDAKLSTFDSIATALGVPLWVLFIPTLQPSDLHSSNRGRLMALVENYLRCDNDSRRHAENITAAFAAVGVPVRNPVYAIADRLGAP